MPPTLRDPFAFGRSSLRLGSVFGIEVRAHFLWLMLAMVLAFVSPPFLAYVLVLFLAVFLHELGHSLVAQHYGIHVVEITFWPLGGMARMTEIPEDPRIETNIAIAGPLVNFALAALSLLALFLSLGVGFGGAANAALNFLGINMMLGVFNLIPAFPMDGGRVLRAYFGRTQDWVRATERAVRIGRIVAGTLVVLSFFLPVWTCMIALIAAFVWFAGAQELHAVRMRHGLSPFGGFSQPGAAPPPRPTAAEFREPRTHGPESSEGTAQRPHNWQGPEVRHSGGFSEAEVAELERFRGRLKPPTD